MNRDLCGLFLIFIPHILYNFIFSLIVLRNKYNQKLGVECIYRNFLIYLMSYPTQIKTHTISTFCRHVFIKMNQNVMRIKTKATVLFPMTNFGLRTRTVTQ